ncbi:hypothetical protein LTR36_006064 [Oleoguttula mirabilis]|uniref:Glutaminase A central domain-containing protein n=1 Tax=Oleoguttula mirabilis TaxID=1507867 RepID=A0AAV9JCK3_9PEZI|nr:hypothetical protein LTR36_006064 [Oleoguttula mirabilis]
MFHPKRDEASVDSLFPYLEAGLLTQDDYALHDLGKNLNATGAWTEMQPPEESGSMLIVTLAYAQKTGGTQFLSDHYGLLNQWTPYFVKYSLYLEK